MFRLFRYTRRNLLNEHKTVKYLKYAVGEVFLIMLGIFLALQLNNWNEGRKLQEERVRLIMNLKADFQMNLNRLDETLNGADIIVEGLETFLNMAAKDVPDFTVEELMSKSRYAFRAILFEPVLSAYNASLATGLIYTLENPRLNELVAKFESDYQMYKTTQSQEIHDQFSGTTSQLRSSIGSLNIFDDEDELILPNRYDLSLEQYRELVTRRDVYAAFEAKYELKGRQFGQLQGVKETTEQILTALEAL